MLEACICGEELMFGLTVQHDVFQWLRWGRSTTTLQITREPSRTYGEATLCACVCVYVMCEFE